MPCKPALLFQREIELDGAVNPTPVCVCTFGPIAFTWVRHTCLPVNMSWVVSIVHPTTEWDESTQPWESDTPKFPLLPYRGQPQGRAATEAAAAEGPDSDAGCSRELCQGNHGSLTPDWTWGLVSAVGIILFCSIAGGFTGEMTATKSLSVPTATLIPQDSCVRQALHCHRLTKLITLQIHFLNTGQNTMLINLGRHRLMDCIMALPRFYQVSKEEKPSPCFQHPLSCCPCHRTQKLSGLPKASGQVTEPGQSSSPTAFP